jgi:glycosyltransferase involved in cell wall biosynthesis
MPVISIIVPIYNTQQYLLNCVNSILCQTFSDFELILIDDGSTDKSGKICDSIKDKRIKVIHQKNLGVSSARNTGLRHATGEYITFVDSDDSIEPNMLEMLYASAINNHSDIVICGITPRCNESLFETLSYNEYWGPYMKLIKRKAIHHNFDPNTSIGEDLLFCYQNYHFWQRYSFIPEQLYHYNIHTGSSIRKKDVTQKDLTYLNVILRIIDDHALTDKLRAFYKAHYIHVYYYIFSRKTQAKNINNKKTRYAQHIDIFYSQAKKYHFITPKIFLQYHLNWLYNIYKRIS